MKAIFHDAILVQGLQIFPYIILVQGSLLMSIDIRGLFFMLIIMQLIKS